MTTMLGLRLLAKRRPALLASAVRLASTEAKAPLILKSLSDDGILTLRFNLEKKLNAWTMPLMTQLFSDMTEAGSDPGVKGVIITGAGKYYSAGVDLSAMIKPMAPSKLVRQIRDSNEKVFLAFINFPKPIVAAVNGPAIGATVTSATLMDGIIASERATFSLPFAKLGVPPEGCSSVVFPEKMGESKAQRMLGPENWIPTAAEALDAGLIDEVVPGEGVEALEARAAEFIRGRIVAGGGRRYVDGEAERLIKVNAEESATLANAFVSTPFLEAMYDFNTKRKKSQLATTFWVAKTTLPLWQPPKIAPSYAEA